MIGFKMTLVSKKYVAHGHNGCMSDQGVEVSALDFFSQLQILLGHFEEHFDIPTFPIDLDDIFVRKMDIGRQRRIPQSCG